MSSIILCLDDLLAKVQSIAELQTSSKLVFSPEELVKLIKGTAVPALGLVYEGMQAIAEEQSNTVRGLGSTATFGLYLAVDAPQVMHPLNKANAAIILLSAIRSKVFNQKAPAGHFWQFLSETYVDSFPARTLWVQKWSTKIMIPN